MEKQIQPIIEALKKYGFVHDQEKYNRHPNNNEKRFRVFENDFRVEVQFTSNELVVDFSIEVYKRYPEDYGICSEIGADDVSCNQRENTKFYFDREYNFDLEETLEHIEFLCTTTERNNLVGEPL